MNKIILGLIFSVSLLFSCGAPSPNPPTDYTWETKGQQLLSNTYSSFDYEYIFDNGSASLTNKYSLSNINGDACKISYNIEKFTLLPSLEETFEPSLSFKTNIIGTSDYSNGSYSHLTGDDFELSIKPNILSKIPFNAEYLEIIEYSSNSINGKIIKSFNQQQNLIKGNFELKYSNDLLISAYFKLEYLNYFVTYDFSSFN